MKFRVVFIIFIIASLLKDAKGKTTFESIMDLFFPRQPQVSRFRHIEDANGDPFAVLDTVGLVEQYGYPAEEHKLTTIDGYNLVFFRIPGSPKSAPAKGKPVVFMQHGLTFSSDGWVFMGPKQALAFLLADAGYDVWIGNIRGNTYCRSHINLTTADEEFWRFSWHESGTIDIPSMLDYVLDSTGHKTLLYVGHSMGTTMTYVLLSEKPEYNKKIRLIVSLAPSGCWVYKPHPIYSFVMINRLAFQNITESIGIYDLFPQTKFYAVVAEAFCSSRSPMQSLCRSAYNSILMPIVGGKPADGFNITLLTHIAKYFPAGASAYQFLHYAQCFMSGEFKKFDFGPAENLIKYGTKDPPFYDLSKITTPYALFYGYTDELASAKNSVELCKRLPNVVTCEAVPSAVFNHFDFLWAVNIKKLLNDRVMEFLAKYKN